MALLSDRAAANVASVLFLAAAGVAVFQLPDGAVLPVCVATAAVAFSALFAVRAYVRRIERVVKVLKDAEERVPMAVPADLLGERERAFLGVTGVREPDVHLAAIRRREERIISLGVFFGMAGMCAVLVTIVVYGD